MADTNVNDESVEPPRENMISTAVTFLQNPKVTSSPSSQKRTFLEKKGLTKEEIDIAFSRAGVTDTAIVPAGGQGVPVAPQGAVYPQGVPVGAVVVPEPQSGWAKLRDYTATIIVVGGVSYGLYQLYKKYLMPLWYGPSQEEKHLKAIEKSISELQQNISETLACIKEMQASVTSQQRQADNMSSTGMPLSPEFDRTHVNEIKDEIKSLKGLMLSRKQFPPPPVTQPVLPAWQLAPSKTEEETTAANSSTVSAGGVTLEPLEDVISTDKSTGEQTSLAASQTTDDSTTENKDDGAPTLMNGHVSNGIPDESDDITGQGSSALAAKSDVPTEPVTEILTKGDAPTETLVQETATS